MTFEFIILGCQTRRRRGHYRSGVSLGPLRYLISMGAKQMQLLTNIHDRISAGDFGESDVLLLLILLREGVREGSILRELADFVAHRRREKGRVHAYMLKLKRTIDSPKSNQFGISTIFTEVEIAEALNVISY